MIQKQTLYRAEELKHVIPLSGGGELPLSRPLIMGILNVTPDSFSDGGRFLDTEAAIAHGLKMIDDGADIIDIGGESSRPGAMPVSADEEQARVVSVIQGIRKKSKLPISIDSYRAATVRIAIEAGANMINDISALAYDTGMAAVAIETSAPVILMHMQGSPEQMQKNPNYVDCVTEIDRFFGERIEFCMQAGIEKSKLILDPGIGFGKRLSDNLEIIAQLSTFKKHNLPLMIGASRKSFISMLNPASENAADRLGGSLAAAVLAVQGGANIVRAHDVRETVEALKITQAVRGTK